MTLSTRSRVEGLADPDPKTLIAYVEGLAATAILVNHCDGKLPLKNIVANSAMIAFPSMTSPRFYSANQEFAKGVPRNALSEIKGNSKRWAPLPRKR